MRNKVQAAMRLAIMAHHGQYDKAGKPYIYHLIRVAKMGTTDIERIVGLLHDVLEDTCTDYMLIIEKFGQEVFEAIDSVTRRPDEKYTDFVLRAKQHPVGKMVKLYDVRDHLNTMDAVPFPEAKFLRTRYEKALEVLTSCPK
jgi:(p)ppGpp synthase/HD superfamily hydrolase